MERIVERLKRLNVWLCSFPTDKYAHFIGGAVAGFAAACASLALGLCSWSAALAGLAFSALVGAAKEFADSKVGGSSELADFAVTTAGGAAASAAALLEILALSV